LISFSFKYEEALLPKKIVQNGGGHERKQVQFKRRKTNANDNFKFNFEDKNMFWKKVQDAGSHSIFCRLTFYDCF
jgi:hypothetical protein